MSYQYNANDLRTFKDQYLKGIEKLEKLVPSLRNASESAFHDDGWQGKTAEKYGEYYSKVYLNAFRELDMLSSTLKDLMKSYFIEYTVNVDSDKHAVIYRKETDMVLDGLRSRISQVREISSSVSQQISAVRDLTGGIRYDQPEIEYRIRNVVQQIESMYDRMAGAESGTAESLAGLLDGFKSLNDLLDVALTAKISSDGRSIEVDFLKLSNASMRVETVYGEEAAWREANSERLRAINELVEADEVAIREEQAATVKLIVGIACAVAAVTATVLTGGAFAAVVIAGAATGAVTAGVNSAADQYVEGGWDNIDLMEVGKDAAIGGIVGGVTSAAGAGLSSVTSSIPFIQTGMQSSNAVVHIASFTASGAISGVGTGVVSRATNSTLHQVIDDGSLDLGELASDTFSKDMVGDLVMGSFSGTISGTIDYRTRMVPADGIPLNEKGEADWPKENLTRTEYGAVRGSEKLETLEPGTKVIRYGKEYGGYFAPEGTPYDQLSLPYSTESANMNYHEYVVVKPLPVESGTVAPIPEFNTPGGGIQYRVPTNVSGNDGVNTSMKELIKGGYIKEVITPGKVIQDVNNSFKNSTSLVITHNTTSQKQD